MSEPPPPPPPEGHVGVYAGAPAPAAASWWDRTKADLATKAKEASDKAALVAKEASEKAVEATRSQVAALDAKFEVSGTVERWSGVAKARATQATPEERQRWCDMAATTLGAVAVVGGAKTRAAAALATAGATAHRAHAAPSAGATSSSSTGAARSSSAEPSDLIECVEVEALVDAGQPQLVEYNGTQYTVTVPAGVKRGETFVCELPLTPSAPAKPAVARAEPAVPEAVPVGLPVGGPAPGAAAGGGVPMGLPVTGSGAGGAPQPAQQASQPAQSEARNPWGALSSAVATVSTVAAAARATSQLASDLGITPQQAAKAAQSGVKLARDMGITPEEALRAGAAGARVLGATRQPPQ